MQTNKTFYIQSNHSVTAWNVFGLEPRKKAGISLSFLSLFYVLTFFSETEAESLQRDEYSFTFSCPAMG